MTIKRDLEGQIFNNLRVLSFSRFSKPIFSKGINKGRRKYWLCRCEKCGLITEQREDSLLNGHSKSCGCLQKEKVSKHGQWARDNSLFWRYNMIVQRCYNEKNKSYKNYGGRGIKMCDEWRNNPKSFLDWAYESGYRKDLTIERIDVDGDYCPENCTWITKEEQQKNKRSNVKIIYHGNIYCNAEICRLLGFGRNAIRYYSKRGMSNQEAFELILKRRKIC